jgi:NAD(P)H dehydrogenase (quinone)
MDKKKILVLHANPNKSESFTWAICEQYIKGLKEAGTPYELVDLYKINFNPILSREDMASMMDPSASDYAKEGWKPRKWIIDSAAEKYSFLGKLYARWMIRGKTSEELSEGIYQHVPKDVQVQREKVKSAEGITFIAPVHWLNFPVILDGWIQRVFGYNFAYALEEDGWAGYADGRKPLLGNMLEKALIIWTTHFRPEVYNKPISPDKDVTLKDAMEAKINYWGLAMPGIKNVESVYFYSVMPLGSDVREKYKKRAYDLGTTFWDKQ